MFTSCLVGSTRALSLCRWKSVHQQKGAASAFKIASLWDFFWGGGQDGKQPQMLRNHANTLIASSTPPGPSSSALTPTVVTDPPPLHVFTSCPSPSSFISPHSPEQRPHCVGWWGQSERGAGIGGGERAEGGFSRGATATSLEPLGGLLSLWGQSGFLRHYFSRRKTLQNKLFVFFYYSFQKQRLLLYILVKCK